MPFKSLFEISKEWFETNIIKYLAWHNILISNILVCCSPSPRGSSHYFLHLGKGQCRTERHLGVCHCRIPSPRHHVAEISRQNSRRSPCHQKWWGYTSFTLSRTLYLGRRKKEEIFLKLSPTYITKAPRFRQKIQKSKWQHKRVRLITRRLRADLGQSLWVTTTTKLVWF